MKQRKSDVVATWWDVELSPEELSILRKWFGRKKLDGLYGVEIVGGQARVVFMGAAKTSAKRKAA